jgi:ATP-dependent DNA helicase RecQ
MNPQELLNKFFGYDSFRPGQLEIINSILNKKDTLAIMPTGGGKSICYQIPSLIFPGTTIVVSPLIALMKDQVDVLNSKGIPASFINSTLSPEEIKIVYSNLLNGKVKMLYLAPERINSKQFLEIIKQVNISLIAIDEAHCISEWGHDFRPSYREIMVLADILYQSPVSAFTATATPEVKDDIINSLRMTNPTVVQKSFDRENLSYKVEITKDKVNSIRKHLKGLKGSAMIYCGSRKRVEKYYRELKQKFKDITYYHAGLPENFRRQEQENFLSGKKKIIVATSAFGMGIDKSDVRMVFHTDLTPTLESYYQEAGRAGRDGKASECYVLFEEGDRGLQDFFISISYPDISKILRVYEFLYDLAGVKTGDFPRHVITEDLNKMAVKLSMDSGELRSIIKFLERNNILKWGKSFSKLRVRVIASKDRIIEYFDYCEEDQKKLLEAILRSFPMSELNSYQEIDPAELTYKFGIKKDLLEKNIRKLEFVEILETNFSSKIGIHLLLARSEKGEYPFDTKKYINKKNSLIKKLDKVEEYIKTNSCKRNFILDYFGETANNNCGKCSWCLGEKYDSSEEKDKFIIRTLNDAKRNFPKENTKAFFKDLLFGSNTKLVKEKGLKNNMLFGELKGISKNDFDKAWNQSKSKEINTSILDEVLAGFSFREIAKNQSKKPSILAKEISDLKPDISAVFTLFDRDQVEKIIDEYRSNNKANARIIQQNLELDLNFIEIKLILSLLKN